MKKILFVFTILTILSGCKEKDAESVFNDNFCSCVTRENVDGTIPIINEYLNSLDKNLTDSIKLVKLIENLKRKDCIINANLVCFGCIYTDPPQSNIYITFKFADGGTNFMNLSIRHNPLQALIYYQIIVN